MRYGDSSGESAAGRAGRVRRDGDHVLQAVPDGDRPRRLTATASTCRRFVWVAWDESLIDHHAEVKYLSFRGEIDAYVFPCLGDRYGCQRLMREIRRKPGFLPGATWLIACPEATSARCKG